MSNIAGYFSCPVLLIVNHCNDHSTLPSELGSDRVDKENNKISSKFCPTEVERAGWSLVSGYPARGLAGSMVVIICKLA